MRLSHLVAISNGITRQSIIMMGRMTTTEISTGNAMSPDSLLSNHCDSTGHDVSFTCLRWLWSFSVDSTVAIDALELAKYKVGDTSNGYGTRRHTCLVRHFHWAHLAPNRRRTIGGVIYRCGVGHKLFTVRGDRYYPGQVMQGGIVQDGQRTPS